MNFTAITTTLQGKRTYIATGMGLLYVAGVFIGLWDWDDRVLAVFGLTGLGFLRAAVPKAAPAATDNSHNSHSSPSSHSALILLAFSAALILLTGCARFSTIQTDTRTEYDQDGKITATTTIATRAKASTIFSSRSDLANWKAQQSEGEQGAEVGSLSQESSGTNAVEILRALQGIAESLPR